MQLPYDQLIPGLSFLLVIFVGSLFLAFRFKREIEIRRRLDEQQSNGSDASENTGIPTLVARVGSTFSSGDKSKTLRAQLARAGYHEKNAAAVYLGSKFILFALGLLSGSFLALTLSIPTPTKVLLLLAGSAFLFFIPNLIVEVNRKKRETDIRRHLPDAVDLLEICVSSGMGLDMAWNAVSDEIRGVSTTLADEMALTNLEMHLGATRVVAMRNMVARTGADELGSLVAVLVQSERFGTSVGAALRSFAGTAREVRSQKAEESAEKTAVKLLFPMVFFIFPAVLIVVGGPAGLRLVEIMGSS